MKTREQIEQMLADLRADYYRQIDIGDYERAARISRSVATLQWVLDD